MACTSCHAWTGIGWRQVRAAMKSGFLHLERPRPNAPALLAAAAEEAGQPPVHPSLVFDKLLVNPKRGPWDLYLKAWPLMVAVLIAAGSLSPRSTLATEPGGYSSGSGAGTLVVAPAYGDAHVCWEATDGTIRGCRMSTGTIVGTATGSTVTCYFTEPLSSTETTLRCDR